MKPTFALLAALPLAALPFTAHAATTPAANPATRNFTATVPAAALTRVRIGVLVGQVTVRAGTANAVKVRVSAKPGNHGHFIFDWTFGPSATTLPADLHLVSRREGGTLYLCLASRHANGCASNPEASSAGTKNGAASTSHTNVITPFGPVDVGGGHHSGWKSDWTIALPARLALKLNLDVGKADIAGVGGGTNIQVGVGKLDAQLPRGPLAANVGVGDIEAEIGSADYGSVDLSAGVGHVEFDVKGERVKSGFEKHTVASSQRLTGPGTTSYDLEAGVGHVKLKLGIEGLQSLPPLTASTTSATSAPAPASQTKPAVPASAPQTTSAPAAATSERS